MKNLNTVVPRYNAPQYNAVLDITRFLEPNFFIPHFGTIQVSKYYRVLQFQPNKKARDFAQSYC